MHLATFIVHWLQHYRPVVPEDAGGAMENPDFGRSDIPISTKGADYAPPNNTGTPGFSYVPSDGPEQTRTVF